MTKKEHLAKIILSMTYAELIDVADDLVAMQLGATEDNWEWYPREVHGQYGLCHMIHSWAESI